MSVVQHDLLEYLKEEFQDFDVDYMASVLSRATDVQVGENFYDGDAIYIRKIDENLRIRVGVTYRELHVDLGLDELVPMLNRLGIKRLN